MDTGQTTMYATIGLVVVTIGYTVFTAKLWHSTKHLAQANDKLCALTKLQCFKQEIDTISMLLQIPSGTYTTWTGPHPDAYKKLYFLKVGEYISQMKEHEEPSQDLLKHLDALRIAFESKVPPNTDDPYAEPLRKATNPKG